MSSKKSHSREKFWADLPFSFTCGGTFLWSLAYNTGESSGYGRMNRMFLGSLVERLSLGIYFIQNGLVFVRDFSQRTYHEQEWGVHLTVQTNWHPMREATAADPLKAISDSENVLHSYGWDLHYMWHAHVRVFHSAALGPTCKESNGKYWVFICAKHSRLPSFLCSSIILFL